ncbi:hypothetical protein ABH909_004928 [Pseudomonas sp. BS3782 TE3695]
MNLKAWSGQVVLRVSYDDELPLPPMAGVELQRVFVVLKLLEEVIRKIVV